MDYKYLAKNHISEQQTIIVRDYFETPLETHGNHLDHITHICQYYNISAPLLRIMVSHFKIFVSPRPSHLFHRKLKRDNVHDFQ